VEDGKLTVRAVERAMDILLCFADVKELSLTEISSKVTLHKSTVHRLLASLEGKGFILRDGNTEKYRLGFRLWELSANLIQSDDMGVVLLPEMERLRDQVMSVLEYKRYRAIKPYGVLPLLAQECRFLSEPLARSCLPMQMRRFRNVY
jgi:transcription initiation factor IIE alpha subunit